MEQSFSKDIRSELLKQIPKNLSERQALIAGLFLTGRPDKDRKFSLSYRASSDDFKTESEYVISALKAAGFNSTLIPSENHAVVSIAKDSVQEFTDCFDMCFTEKSADMLSSSPDFVKSFLKGVFLSCGYCSDPNKSYRIELHVSNSHVVTLIVWMLHSIDIEPSVSVRGAKTILRFREGDAIATFFAVTGAVKAYLDFENIRVAREVTGNVNRVVNCDSGNSRRQAEAGARRTEMFQRLLASPESSSLPKELLMAAQVHIANPGLSIAELGALMDPPISKSGMNHRLIKLEEIAKELK